MPATLAQSRVVLSAAVLMTALSSLAVIAPAASSASSTSPAPPAQVSLPVPAAQASPRPVRPRFTSLPLRPAKVSAAVAGRGAAILTAPSTVADFQTLGVTWRPVGTPPDLAISVRTRRQHEKAPAWTPWTELDTDDDDSTEDPVAATGLSPAQAAAAGLRSGTSSLWVGPSDGVQGRVAVRSGSLPPDLRADLIDPGSSAADAVPQPAVPPPAVPQLPLQPQVRSSAVQAAGAVQPPIYSRRAWGADESKVRHAPAYMSTIKAAVIHHTAGPNHYSKAQVPAIIRGDYAYHLHRGWSDIGYNALVDRFGRIWEGRAGGIGKAVMGAHAGGFNSYTFGVSVIGNYDKVRPSASSVEAVARVIAWKLDLNHRDPLGTTRLTSAGGGTARYRAGTTVTLPVVMGHRNTGHTACPGRYLYPYLPHIRQRVRSLIRAELTNPAGSPISTTPGAPAWISARSLSAQSWSLRVTQACTGAVIFTGSGQVRAGQSFRASWNGRLSDGSLPLPGAYSLTLTSRSSTAVARPVSRTVLIQPPLLPAPAAAPPSSGAGGFTALTPVRLAGLGGQTTLAVGPGRRAALPVLGRGGVPSAGVTSVMLNLTTGCASSRSSLEVWPTGGTRTGHPAAFAVPGSPASTLITSQVGANGSVSITGGTGVTQLTADVVGYYSAAGQKLIAVPATRILDTSSSGGPIVAGATRPVSLPASIGGVPASSISGVIASVTALSPSAPGSLTASGLPALVFRTGRPTENLAVIPVANGAFTLTANGGSTQVSVDVRAVVASNGSGAGLTAITPKQVLDATVAAGSPRAITITGGTTGVPPGATGVLIGLTALTPSATGYAEVYPAGSTPGPGTAMRVNRGQSQATQVLVPIGANGAIMIKLGAGRAVTRADVRGYLF